MIGPMGFLWAARLGSVGGVVAATSRRFPLRAVHQAFSLVEVSLAIGVMAFCLLALFALLPVGMRTNHAATEQTGAALVATNVQSDLLGVEKGKWVSTRYHFVLPKPGAVAAETPQVAYVGEHGDGKVANMATEEARYRVSIGFFPPVAPDRFATRVRVLITWPAAADTGNGWPKVYAGAFETVVALDQN